MEKKRKAHQKSPPRIISVSPCESNDPIKRKHEIDLTIEDIYTTKKQKEGLLTGGVSQPATKDESFCCVF